LGLGGVAAAGCCFDAAGCVWAQAAEGAEAAACATVGRARTHVSLYALSNGLGASALKASWAMHELLESARGCMPVMQFCPV
jgi:hypothetical protein